MSAVRFCIGVGVAAFYVVFLIVESAGECDHSVAGDCTKAFSNRPSPDKFIYTKEERKDACNDLNEFLSCFEATGCQTLEIVVPVYKGLKNATNFMCIEENHRYEEVATCWEWNGFQDARNFCFEMFGNRSDVIKCEDRNSMLSCMIRSVDRCCGNETAAYARRSATLLLTPALLMANCDLKLDDDIITIDTCSSMSSSSGLSVAVIVVITFIIIIIIVVVVVIVIIRKSGGTQWLVGTQWLSI